MATQTLHVRIISPTKLILDTQATSVSSKNPDGSFDILAEHANFITLVENSPIIIRVPDQKPLSFTYPLAIIMASQDKVNIYTYVQPSQDKK